MKSRIRTTTMSAFALALSVLIAPVTKAAFGTVNNDAWWQDAQNQTIMAQGAYVAKFGNTYYLYGGEDQTMVAYAETGNAGSDETWHGINVYTSTNLVSWSAKTVALAPSSAMPASSTWINRVCGVIQAGGQYVMWMKGGGVPGANGGVLCATSSSPTGPFTYHHAQTIEGLYFQPLPGDGSIFVNPNDGKPYFICADSHGRQRAYICQISADGLSISSPTQIALWAQGQEANNMFYSAKSGRYYYVTSETNGYSYSKAYQVNSTTLLSGYSADAFFEGTEATNTYWAQVNSSILLNGTTDSLHVQLCDRWGNKHPNYAAAGHGIGYNVWAPITVTAANPTPVFNAMQTWQLDAAAGTWQSGGGGPAAPTYAGTGSAAKGTGTVTPGLPSGLQTGDILLLFVETANQAVSVSNPNGGTWSTVPGTPQGTGTAGGADATSLTVFWSRYNGTQGAPTVSDSGDHQIARIIAVRGAVSSGNPWDVTAGAVDTFVDTGASIPGATTTVANTLIVAASFGALPDAVTTAGISSYTNSALSSLTERIDNTYDVGNGGSIGIATGIMATPGAYGTTSAVHTTATKKAMVSIAIKP